MYPFTYFLRVEFRSSLVGGRSGDFQPLHCDEFTVKKAAREVLIEVIEVLFRAGEHTSRLPYMAVSRMNIYFIEEWDKINGKSNCLTESEEVQNTKEFG